MAVEEMARKTAAINYEILIAHGLSDGLDAFGSEGDQMPFVLIIGERSNSWAGRSPVVSLHHNREQATANLVEYVKRNWDDEVGGDVPEEADEMIEQYFEEVLEQYDIQEVQFK